MTNQMTPIFTQTSAKLKIASLAHGNCNHDARLIKSTTPPYLPFKSAGAHARATKLAIAPASINIIPMSILRSVTKIKEIIKIIADKVAKAIVSPSLSAFAPPADPMFIINLKSKKFLIIVIGLSVCCILATTIALDIQSREINPTKIGKQIVNLNFHWYSRFFKAWLSSNHI
jgi:hypothetical protein